MNRKPKKKKKKEEQKKTENTKGEKNLVSRVVIIFHSGNYLFFFWGKQRL
jgi:hypothetical protein